jgi:hypothetical protein
VQRSYTAIVVKEEWGILTTGRRCGPHEAAVQRAKREEVSSGGGQSTLREFGGLDGGEVEWRLDNGERAASGIEGRKRVGADC